MENEVDTLIWILIIIISAFISSAFIWIVFIDNTYINKIKQWMSRILK